ncbi:MAG: phage terminase large subunit, partial [Euryarchaeota archaeon]|nr:phage terminase large subunit [Euryarchaeota archaeon]
MSKAANTVRLIQREIGRRSILKFAKIYFSDYMTSLPCSFHEEICKILMEMSEKRNRNLAVAAPRGHAKSTIVSLFYAVWSICYSKENYIVLFSATKAQAVTLMSDIKRALESNEELIRDFPEVCHAGEGLNKYQWTQQVIETRNGIKVHALGYEGEARGFKFGQHKPTLIIFDDIDGDKNTYSSKSRSDLLKWFKSTVRYIGSKRTNMVAVGTLLHTDSLLARFINNNEFQNWNEKKTYKAVISDAKREDLWEKWIKIVFYQEKYQGKISKYQFDEERLDFEAILSKLVERHYINEDYHVAEVFNGLDEVFKSSLPEFNEEQFKKIEAILNYFRQEQGGLKAADSFFNDHKELMLQGSKVLWEEEYDYYSLMNIKKIDGPYEFNREMQNDPRNLEDCYFNPEKFIYWTDKYQTEADLVNDLRDDLEYFGACDPSMGGGKSKNLDYSAIIILARHIKENIFYILKADIKQRPPEELIQDIVNCHRGRNFSGFVIESNLFQGLFIPSIRTQAAQEGVHTSIQPMCNMNNKEHRIEQLGNYITPGWLRFCKDHDRLLEQLSDFPMSSHNDGPDPLEMAL